MRSACAAIVLLATLAIGGHAQARCPLGTCSPRVAVALAGEWAPSVTLGVFWTKALTPAPPLPVPGRGPAPIVESHWSLRALLSTGLTFAAPRGYGVDMTGFGYFGALRDVELGPVNRLGAVVVGSINPNAAGLAARAEAPARVAGLQLGWVRQFDGDVNRAFGSLDVSFGFLACDILQRCPGGM